MTRNRHSRLNDHFGYDLDTEMVLDGAVGDIPSGTLLHDALIMLQSGGEEAVPRNWADPALGTLVFYHDGTWDVGPLIQDEDLDTYHTADGADCMRVELDEPRLAYQATVRMAFGTTTERTYGFYGTDEADYSNLVLLDELTFEPAGSDTAENFVFDWAAANPYRYYVLEGPSETRRLHELTLYALTGAISASHPLLLDRDLTAQHPAAAVSFDDAVALLDETTVQGAIEKLAASTSGGSGISAVLASVVPGVKFDLEMPFAGRISAVRLLADQVGSLVVDLWKDSYANFPPTVADSICAAAKPTLSSALKYQNTTLTGWTTAFNVGDVIRINVDSSSTLTRVTLALRLERNASSPVVAGITLPRIDRTATLREPVITGGLKTISLGLITRTAVAHSPAVAGGTVALGISVARISRVAIASPPTVTGGVVGGSDYPPNTTLKNTVPPAVPAIPAYLTPYYPPNWPSIKVTRVSAIHGQRNIYSRVAGWNSDQSMILLSDTGIQPVTCILNGQPPYNKLHDLPFLVGMAQWSNQNPNKIWGTWSGENYLRSQTWNGSSWVGPTIEHTFTGYVDITLGDSEGGLSDDDDTVVLMGVTTGGGQRILVFDISSHTVVTTITPPTRPDTAFVSRSGNYVLAYYSKPGDPDGPGVDQGLWIYNRDGTNLRQLTQSARHGDVARLADGSDVWAQTAFGGEYFRMDNGAHTYLFSALQPYPHNTAFSLGHLSGRATLRNGWVYLSSYNYTATGSGQLVYGRDQIVAANLDIPGQIEEFGWSYHRLNADTAAGYVTSPFATVSRDGKKVLWGGAWGDTTLPYSPVYAYISERR